MNFSIMHTSIRIWYCVFGIITPIKYLCRVPCSCCHTVGLMHCSVSPESYGLFTVWWVQFTRKLETKYFFDTVLDIVLTGILSK